MNVLIIGDHPKTIGGVTNYTRPLALALAGHSKVFYLYNSSRTSNFDFGRMRIEKQDDLFSEFLSFELVNGKGLEKNYENLNVDTGNWFDALFTDFIRNHKIEVVHINEIFGFSSNIINIAKSLGVKVIVSVHEYWWLCPHRVMVDYDRKICEGPFSMKKCSNCVHTKIVGNHNRTILKEKIKNQFKGSHGLYSSIKKSIQGYKKNSEETESLDFDNIQFNGFSMPVLEKSLQQRLDNNISALNNCDAVIAVSKDVEVKLTQYGVSPDKIIVQHIGSTIATQKVAHTKKIDPRNIVFGFIGGVGYYKGIHQLVDAFSKLPEGYISKAQLKIYGGYSESYYKSIQSSYLSNGLGEKKVMFYGRYKPEEIPQITNELDIMVLPSLCADTAPQTIFESFSTGLPIIAPNIGGFPDFITDSQNGLLYEQASVDDLKSKLMQIIDEPEMINELQKNIPRLKTIQANAQELNDLYMDVVHNKIVNG